MPGVVAYLTASGATVEFEQLGSGRNGYSAPANQETGAPIRVVIKNGNEPGPSKTKTALHEAAHIVLGHLQDDFGEYVAHRGRHEVEAESVAYVVAGMLGLDSSAYSTGYVAGWASSAETDVLEDTASRVLNAVHVMVEALQIEGHEARKMPRPPDSPRHPGVTNSL